MPWLLASIVAFTILLVAIDLTSLEPRRAGAGGWARVILYALLAAAFGGFLHAGVNAGWLPALGAPGQGRNAAVSFGTAFIWQLVLDLDGLLVINALFAAVGATRTDRRRALMWGVLPALLVRGSLVFGGAELLRQFAWVKFILAGVLILAALRMLTIRQNNLDPQRSILLRGLQRIIPLSRRRDRAGLLTRVEGRLSATPLLSMIVLVETADAILALDSVPAVLGVSKSAALAFAGNAFALLCLRTLFSFTTTTVPWLRPLKVGLSCSLLYAAVLIALPPSLQPSPFESGLVLGLSIATGALVGYLARPNSDTPLGPDADRLAKTALRHAKRISITLIGVSLLALGAFMLLGPGPGIPVVFIALAVLGTEFDWARRLMTKYRAKAEYAVESTAAAARRRFRPWILIPMILLTIAGIFAVGRWFNVSTSGLVLAALPPVLGQLAWGYVAFFRPAPTDPPPPPPT